MFPEASILRGRGAVAPPPPHENIGVAPPNNFVNLKNS